MEEIHCKLREDIRQRRLRTGFTWVAALDGEFTAYFGLHVFT